MAEETRSEDEGWPASAHSGSKGLRTLRVEQLLLDSLNPRLPEELHGADQETLLKTLAKDYSLQEIGQSLVDNGYFWEEPLVAVPGIDPDTYTVVEGNRRLAALKLLLDPSLAQSLRLKSWAELTRDCKQELDKVPVLVYERRDQVIPFLGFRHISGILKWDPLAKARFISQLVNDGKEFSSIAREIGSKAPTVRGNYAAYRLLMQAENYEIDTSGAEREFAVLYRSMSSPEVREFIGLDLSRSESELSKPIPEEKVERVKELLSWMFGDESQKPAMTDSRQITQLGEVLSSEEATNALKTSRDLEYAYRLVGGEERRMLDHLKEASFHLDEALPDAHRNKQSDKVKAAVKRCYETLREIVRHFPKVTEEVR